MKIYPITNNVTCNFQKNSRKSAKTEFSDEVIAEAKRIIEENEEINPGTYKKSFFDCWKNTKIQPLEWCISPLAILAAKALNEPLDKPLETARLAVGMSTLGVSEILKTPEAGIRKLVSDAKAKKFAEQVQKCVLAMLRERAK